ADPAKEETLVAPAVEEEDGLLFPLQAGDEGPLQGPAEEPLVALLQLLPQVDEADPGEPPPIHPLPHLQPQDAAPCGGIIAFQGGRGAPQDTKGLGPPGPL